MGTRRVSVPGGAGLAGLESNWTNVQFTNVTAAQ